jgi:hypothetical protein
MVSRSGISSVCKYKKDALVTEVVRCCAFHPVSAYRSHGLRASCICDRQKRQHTNIVYVYFSPVVGVVVDHRLRAVGSHSSSTGKRRAIDLPTFRFYYK